MYFIGLLQNVDSSILKVGLENNFKFNSISQEKGTELFSKLEKLSPIHTHRKLAMDYPCFNIKLKKYFFIESSFGVTISKDGYPKGLFEFNQLVNSYLVPTIRLMRLFKDGNIGIPIKYYFFKKPFRQKTSERTLILPSHRPIYTLNEDEIPKLQDFLEKTKMPFRDYVQLAFDSLELSYEIPWGNVAFLSLMNGLEALFNPGEGEIRYRISRNCGVLLGKDKQEANEIFRDVKKLYDLRSAIVHSIKKIKVEEGEILKLRGYLRESIKRLLRINKPKGEVLDILNESSFGEQDGD